MDLFDFTAALASKQPTPGGGGASALTGALGMALGEMVASLTVGKKKYAAVEPEMTALAADAAALRAALLACIERDAAAFAPLAKAYSIPKDDPARAETLEACLRAACAVPLEIMQRTGEAVTLLARIAAIGNTNVLSDAGTGAALCSAALHGAAINVRANTCLMADRAFAEARNAEADALLAEHAAAADALRDAVYASLL